jgi:hypothetical protein
MTQDNLPDDGSCDPDILLVASDEWQQAWEYRQIQRSLTSSVVNPQGAWYRLWNQAPEAIAKAQKISADEWKKMGPIDQVGLIVKLWSGASARTARWCPADARAKIKVEGGAIPKDGDLLFLHPHRTRYYLRASSANQELARERVMVFIRLLGALGAKAVKVTMQTITRRDFLGRARVVTVPVVASADSTITLDRKSSIKISSTFAKPTHPPRVPPGLQSWVDTDGEWRQFVASRIEDGMSKLHVSLDINEKAEYSAGVIGSYHKMGFNVGGKYKAVSQSTQSYEVEFWPNA